MMIQINMNTLILFDKINIMKSGVVIHLGIPNMSNGATVLSIEIFKNNNLLVQLIHSNVILSEVFYFD